MPKTKQSAVVPVGHKVPSKAKPEAMTTEALKLYLGEEVVDCIGRLEALRKRRDDLRPYYAELRSRLSQKEWNQFCQTTFARQRRTVDYWISGRPKPKPKPKPKFIDVTIETPLQQPEPKVINVTIETPPATPAAPTMVLVHQTPQPQPPQQSAYPQDACEFARFMVRQEAEEAAECKSGSDVLAGKASMVAEPPVWASTIKFSTEDLDWLESITDDLYFAAVRQVRAEYEELEDKGLQLAVEVYKNPKLNSNEAWGLAGEYIESSGLDLDDFNGVNENGFTLN